MNNKNIMNNSDNTKVNTNNNDNQPNQPIVSLEQGRELLQYNTDVDKIVSPHLNMIEQGSIIESMENIHSLSTKDKKSLAQLNSLEQQFQTTLAEYTKTYQLFSEDILNKNQTKTRIVDYLGKVISTEDGNNYYVNNYGYTHMYSASTWEKNDNSCPSSSIPYNGHLNKFGRGVLMNIGQPCNIAGKNIVNTETGEQSWVDIEGIKHPYSTNIKSNSCSKKNNINLSKSQYDAIPTGNTMRETDQCQTLDVNPMLWAKLQSLNTKMKSQGMMIAKELETLQLEDTNANIILREKQQELIKYINDISDDKEQLNRYDDVLMNVLGQEQDASSRMTTNYYMYWLWSILMIFILWFTIKNIMSGEPGTIDQEGSTMFYTVIALITLYLVIYLVRKLYMLV